MLEPSKSSSVLWAIGAILSLCILRFFRELHFQRSLFRGLPGPPRSYLFGSIISMAKVLANQPRNAAPQTFMQCLKEHYNLPDTFYFDSWPLGPPMVIICNSELYNEVTIKYSPPKHPLVAKFMINFGGPYNLVSEEGAVWKRWRSAFNPGFSSSHLMSQVPLVVEECKIFCDIMARHAEKNELFRMEHATTKLTVNIIGKIVLDIDLNAQRGQNVLVKSFKSQVQWQAIGAQFRPSELWDFRRYFIQKYNNWKMDSWLSARLDERFAGRDTRGKSKHIIDLALEAYLKEVKGEAGDSIHSKGIDSEFKKAAISNMRTFVFAGHDTTSSTICYAFYYLAKNPEVLARIRAEHDEVFGPDPTKVADLLTEDARLLNKLEYTLAVMKEVLRIQPPASTVRIGVPGLVLHNPETGENLPTEHFMIWPVNVGMHRNAKYWPEPEVFNPDRFVPSSSVYAQNDKDAWVPFSKGPRNCIGLELAIIETKIILAMTLRTFDCTIAYDELEKLKGDGSGYPNLMTGVREQFGERAYQVQLGTAKPAEGMPCRLRFVKR